MTITQIPLRIAYAITTHKSQGMSIDYAEVDMDNIFEDGMGYVSLSRVKSLQGLSVKNFKVGKIFANEKAVKFYENLT
jgi:ATP-dependent exoDNAse (exonuclease V) alpha subunit